MWPRAAAGVRVVENVEEFSDDMLAEVNFRLKDLQPMSMTSWPAVPKSASVKHRAATRSRSGSLTQAKQPRN